MVLGSGFKPLIHSLQIFTECSIYSSYKSVHITGKLCPHTVYILQVEQEVKKITVVTNCTVKKYIGERKREKESMCVCSQNVSGRAFYERVNPWATVWEEEAVVGKDISTGQEHSRKENKERFRMALVISPESLLVTLPSSSIQKDFQSLTKPAYSCPWLCVIIMVCLLVLRRRIRLFCFYV